MSSTNRPLAVRWPVWFVGTLVLGNLTASRGFSHLGVGPIFIGEVALCAALFFGFRVYLSRFVQPLFTPGPLSAAAWGIWLLLGCGVLQGVRGVFSDFGTMTVVKCLPFHFYPLFFFVGVEVESRYRGFLKRFVYWFAWVHGIYGCLFVLVLSPLGLTDAEGSTGVSFFGQPYGAALLIIALMCFTTGFVRTVAPLLLNFFVLLSVQVRAEWLSFGAAFSAWALLTRRVMRLVQICAAFSALLLLAFVTDFRIPAPSTRGGEVSVRAIVGRALTSVSPDLARGLIDDPERYASTVSWRTGWWKNIVRLSHEDPVHATIGLGYGFPIWDYHPEGLGEGLRTPHSIVVWTLGYTGWIGLATYLLMQSSLLAVLWRAYRATGQPFGLLVWVLFNIWACADNLLEAPYGAIPFYLLLGLSAAPAVRTDSTSRRTTEQEVDEDPALS
jgi:hypothetical protein